METKKKSLQYYMRVLHRDLGFLALGMVIVYSLSGIVLIHRTDNFMKTTKKVEMTIAPNLGDKELGDALKMKKFNVIKEENGIVYFADGQYEKATGKVECEKKEVVFPLNKFSNLHKSACAQNQGVGWFTTLFGVILFFLAISSLFMFPTGTKQFKKGMVYTVVGVILTAVLIAVL